MLRRFVISVAVTLPLVFGCSASSDEGSESSRLEEGHKAPAPAPTETTVAQPTPPPSARDAGPSTPASTAEAGPASGDDAGDWTDADIDDPWGYDEDAGDEQIRDKSLRMR